MSSAAAFALACTVVGAGAPATEPPRTQSRMQPAPPNAPPPAAEGPRPPVAKRDPALTTLHGQPRVDEYAWLQKKGAPEVVAHLDGR